MPKISPILTGYKYKLNIKINKTKLTRINKETLNF